MMITYLNNINACNTLSYFLVYTVANEASFDFLLSLFLSLSLSLFLFVSMSLFLFLFLYLFSTSLFLKYALYFIDSCAALVIRNIETSGYVLLFYLHFTVLFLFFSQVLYYVNNADVTSNGS